MTKIDKNNETLIADVVCKARKPLQASLKIDDDIIIA